MPTLVFKEIYFDVRINSVSTTPLSPLIATSNIFQIGIIIKSMDNREFILHRFN